MLECWPHGIARGADAAGPGSQQLERSLSRGRNGRGARVSMRSDAQQDAIAREPRFGRPGGGTLLVATGWGQHRQGSGRSSGRQELLTEGRNDLRKKEGRGFDSSSESKG